MKIDLNNIKISTETLIKLTSIIDKMNIADELKNIDKPTTEELGTEILVLFMTNLYKAEKEIYDFVISYVGLFKEPTEPPHLVVITVDTDNFMADNKVYYGSIPIQLDYTYIDKDIEAQEKIEKEILGDIAWNKTEETYLQDEDVWQVSYFFEL